MGCKVCRTTAHTVLKGAPDFYKFVAESLGDYMQYCESDLLSRTAIQDYVMQISSIDLAVFNQFSDALLRRIFCTADVEPEEENCSDHLGTNLVGLYSAIGEVETRQWGNEVSCYHSAVCGY